MADNYLEKKFEEYASRKSESKVKKIFATGPRPGHLDVKFPPRRVFVTGGAAGIGKAVVKAFRDAGCRVAFCDIDTKNGPLTAQQTGARFYPLDVCDSTALTDCLHDIFATWGDIDILINNVGISRFSPLTETSIEEFDRIIAPICVRHSSQPVNWPATAVRYPNLLLTGASSTLPRPVT